ncbi:hypothetical protein [Streptomyces viridochromogenes]|uniref:hypothetical protein n=1 Tax=Streptomyces viridochromogenes TaxID=1938 RepID=UPI000A3F8932|nr:hypothetical protein [Streptomyces viridochromogenes]
MSNPDHRRGSSPGRGSSRGRSCTEPAPACAGSVANSALDTDFAGHALPSENGFKTVLAIGAGAAALCCALAALLPGRKPGAVPANASAKPSDAAKTAL